MKPKTAPLEQRIVNGLKPSFKELVSIKAAHWAIYADMLEDISMIFEHETTEESIKILNRMIIAYPLSSAQNHALVDVCACLAENDPVTYSTLKFK